MTSEDEKGREEGETLESVSLNTCIDTRIPCCICLITASTILGCECPWLTALNMQTKSRYSFPSTSLQNPSNQQCNTCREKDYLKYKYP